MQEQVSLRRQCELLAIGRSGLYYEAVGTSAEELALMRRIDEIHLKWPFYGARKLCEALGAEGTTVNRKRMKRIMRVMGLESVAPKPDTSEPHPEHPVFPHLLRNLSICRPESGLGRRHHVHSDCPRLLLLGGHHRLVQPPRARVAAVQHHGVELLLGGVSRIGL